MFKALISQGDRTTTLTMATEDPNTSAAIAFEDYSPLSLELLSYLEMQYGLFGHFINPNSTTPVDVMSGLAESVYKVEVLEGAELITDVDPGLEDGEVT